MIHTRGAPFEQGLEQGRRLRGEIVGSVRALRARYAWTSWLGVRRRTRRGSARRTAWFLPQVHERLEGLARGAGLALAPLELLCASQRVPSLAVVHAARIEACLDEPGLEGRTGSGVALCLRTSRPDSGGVPSVELTSAAWAGCLAGVNSEGIAILCLDAGTAHTPALHLLAQDLLLRARALEPGLEHLRRRAAYLVATGRFLIVDAAGDARLGELRAGRLSLREPAPADGRAADPSLRVDAAARTLWWQGDGSGGVELKAPALD